MAKGCFKSLYTVAPTTRLPLKTHYFSKSCMLEKLSVPCCVPRLSTARSCCTFCVPDKYICKKVTVLHYCQTLKKLTGTNFQRYPYSQNQVKTLKHPRRVNPIPLRINKKPKGRRDSHNIYAQLHIMRVIVLVHFPKKCLLKGHQFPYSKKTRASCHR